jgi:hypothetical protein
METENNETRIIGYYTYISNINRRYENHNIIQTLNQSSKIEEKINEQLKDIEESLEKSLEASKNSLKEKNSFII